jgi:hypothetical protein
MLRHEFPRAPRCDCRARRPRLRLDWLLGRKHPGNRRRRQRQWRGYERLLVVVRHQRRPGRGRNGRNGLDRRDRIGPAGPRAFVAPSERRACSRHRHRYRREHRPASGVRGVRESSVRLLRLARVGDLHDGPRLGLHGRREPLCEPARLVHLRDGERLRNERVRRARKGLLTGLARADY